MGQLETRTTGIVSASSSGGAHCLLSRSEAAGCPVLTRLHTRVECALSSKNELGCLDTGPTQWCLVSPRYLFAEGSALCVAARAYDNLGPRAPFEWGQLNGTYVCTPNGRHIASHATSILRS